MCVAVRAVGLRFVGTGDLADGGGERRPVHGALRGAVAAHVGGVSPDLRGVGLLVGRRKIPVPPRRVARDARRVDGRARPRRAARGRAREARLRYSVVTYLVVPRVERVLDDAADELRREDWQLGDERSGGSPPKFV